MNRKLQTFFLLAFPAIFLFLGLSFDRTKFGTDPESAYVMNSLNVAMLKPVGHFDHPGTTVQMYGAVVLRVTHFFRFSGYDLQTDVLLANEYYIEVLRKSLIALNAILMFALGFVAFLLLKSVWLGLILQAAPFMSATLLEISFTKVAPEPLLFAAVMVLAMLLLRYYTSVNQHNKWYPILFGLLGGFGLATKITFLPLLVIPFIILKGSWKKIAYLSVIFPSFILFTLPAAPAYRLMAKWFLNLGTHSGMYGQGSKAVIDPVQYLNSLVLIASRNKELVAVIIVTFLLLAAIFLFPNLRKQRGKYPETPYLLAFLLALTGSVLMVAKHYFVNHYLMSALSLSGIVIVFIYLFAERLFGERGKRLIARLLPFAIAVFVGVALLNKPYLTLARQGYRLSNQDTDETMARIERDYPGFVKTYYYPGSFNNYSAIRWGNIYSRQFHTEMLMKFFPDGLFYNSWENSFQLWETDISPKDFIGKYGGRILLIGGPRNNEEFIKVQEGGLMLKKLFEGRVQVVYEVDTALSGFFKGNIHEHPPVWRLQNDFETISSDKQWVMAGSERFCNISSLINENPRSGKFAFKLPIPDSYAMDYQLKNVKPGQIYEVSIWRFGGEQDASIVVSSAKADRFYVKSNGFSETDSRGWQKLVVNFKVPEGFDEQMLKIYLWNHGGKPAWFDDFRIERYEGK